ncbi:MAG TPA: sugar transferase [Bryobacteraceae bacterium]|nr:sugar transferase [Bryobacteraceae bacterium]
MLLTEKSHFRADSIIPCGRVFHLVHLVFDIGAVALAWRAALELRLLINPYLPVEITRSAMDVVALRLGVVVLLWIGASLLLKTYQDRNDSSVVMALLRVAQSAVVISVLAITVTFFSRQLGADLSRSFVLIFSPVCFLLLNASLGVSIMVTRQIASLWPAAKRVAVVGSGEGAEDIVRAIQRARHANVVVRGLILPETGRGAEMNAERGAGQVATLTRTLTVPVLGSVRQLAELINRECLDRIIVAHDSLSDVEEEYCWQIAARMGVTVSRTVRPARPDLQIRYQEQYGMHLIDISAARFSHWEDVIKRMMDVVASLALITLMLPMFALIALLIRLTSKGPIFYCSPRVGKGGRHFTFWKFRSMYVGGPRRAELTRANEKSGHIFKMRRDPRVTPVGRVLRRLSLDETPQLFNVLAGDMSLVGPRPLPAEDLDPDGMSRKFADWAAQRSLVRPGITGLWQIRGRSELPFNKMMEMDIEYIENWSIRLDLGILLHTPRAIFSGEGAY